MLIITNDFVLAAAVQAVLGQRKEVWDGEVGTRRGVGYHIKVDKNTDNRINQVVGWSRAEKAKWARNFCRYVVTISHAMAASLAIYEATNVCWEESFDFGKDRNLMEYMAGYVGRGGGNSAVTLYNWVAKRNKVLVKKPNTVFKSGPAVDWSAKPLVLLVDELSKDNGDYWECTRASVHKLQGLTLPMVARSRNLVLVSHGDIQQFPPVGCSITN